MQIPKTNKEFHHKSQNYNISQIVPIIKPDNQYLNDFVIFIFNQISYIFIKRL